MNFFGYFDQMENKKYERIRVGQYFWSCEACEASLLNKSKSEVYLVKFARKLRRTRFLVQMWWKSWYGANISPATWFLMFNLLIKSKIYLITSSGEWKIQIIIYDFDIDPGSPGPVTPSKGTYLYELGTALFPKLRRGKIGRRTPKFFGGIFWTKNSIFTMVQIFFCKFTRPNEHEQLYRR